MNSKAVRTLLASAVAAMLAACGGGGGGGDTAATATPPSTTTPTPPAQATLQVSGTVATGAALSAAVQARCFIGSGSTSTNADGSYTVTITDGVLPCRIEAKGVVGGTTNVVLHSLVETGTTNSADRRTIARANVTPVTEMVMAKLLAQQPASAFDGSPTMLSSADVQAATASIVAALKEVGLDLGAIDPLKGDLVAASAAVKGNAYDQLLDVLGSRISGPALTILANQIANAAQSRSDDILRNAMQAVTGGSLAGCPTAVSGTFRSVDLFGTMLTHVIDFKAMRMASTSNTDSMSLAVDPANACVLTATGKFNGADSTMKVVFGSAGAATFHVKSTPVVWDTIGELFPVQRHPYTSLSGDWSALETDLTQKAHRAGMLMLGATGKVTSCTYDASWACRMDTATPTASARSDGGISIPVSSTESATLYGYRAPDGSLLLYGGHEGTSNVAISPVSVLATRLPVMTLPTVGTVVTSWDAGVTLTPDMIISVTDPAPISYEITGASVDTYTRRNQATNRPETLHINSPVSGVRTRDAGTFNGGSFAQLVQIPLAGVGMTLSINAVPWGTNASFLHNIAVVKP